MPIEENKAIVRRYVDEVFNKGGWTALDDIMAPNYIDHVAFHSQKSSREAFKQTFSAFRAAFPDGVVKVEDVIAEDDRVVWRWSWLGTHQGEFRGIAPTDKQITWTGIIIWRIVEGQIVEWWAGERWVELYATARRYT